MTRRLRRGRRREEFDSHLEAANAACSSTKPQIQLRDSCLLCSIILSFSVFGVVKAKKDETPAERGDNRLQCEKRIQSTQHRRTFPE